MVLVNFVAFLLLKILYNLVSMKYLLNANNRWHKLNLENVQRDFVFIFDVLSESRIGFVLFLVFLALENVISFTKLLFIENEAMELCVTMWKRFTPTLATVWRKSF